MVYKRTVRGLTLIELVIAMIILFFTCMSLLEFFDNSIRVELKNRDRTTAVKLAQKILEQQLYDNTSDIDNTIVFKPVDDDHHFVYKLSVNPLNFVDSTTSPPNLKLHVKEVKVVVRGPLDDSGQPIPRTQSIFLKVWRPSHVPSM
jgi:Tfp pilus assembly protein PilV